MPEIKHNFTSGKMNKDLDERLVPNGEYRDANNIQVTTSDESDVGTIQNILGNTPGCVYTGNSINPIQAGSRTIGSVSDERNDSLYWLVAGSGNIQSILPLPNDQTATLKDMIMRTNPEVLSGCEPVFVDKYGFCIGINDPSTQTNSITFNDSNLYSNITNGMTVNGYNGVTSTFGPTLVQGVGNINAIYPLNYQQGVDQVYTNPQPNSFTVSLRTFDTQGCSGGQQIMNYNGVTPCAGYSGNQLNLPQNGFSQIFVPGPALPKDLSVGSTISNSTQYPTGGTITEINYGQICSGYNSQSNCSNSYLLTIDTVPSINPANSAGNSFPYDNENPFVQFTLDITEQPEAFNIPNNTINISPSSDQWLNEIYNILYNPNESLTGNQLKIDSTIGGGNNWPENSCIDPASVVNFADGFNPPSSYDNKLQVVNCDTGVLQNALNTNPQGKPLSLFINDGGSVESVILNDNVNLSNSDTLCFTSERVLEFNSNNLVTGINIVDDMLFWTDNFTEPKKINIPRSIAGTDPDGDTHTAIINNATGLDISNYNPIRREHITVVRKSPKNALTLDLSTGRDISLNYSGITYTSVDPSLNNNINLSSIITSSNNTVISNFSTLKVGDTFRFEIETDMNGLEDFTLSWNTGNTILLKEYNEDGTPPPMPLADYTIRGVITDWQYTSFVNDTSTDNYQAGFVGSQWNGGQVPSSAQGTAHVEIEVLNIKGNPPAPSVNDQPPILNYAVDLESKVDPIFEDKFPRFSYRYKYEDGEYSTFAPFSEVAFLPSHFSYDPKKGYNKGMINNLTSVKFKGFVPTMLGNPIGQDITEVDILYKEEGSPNVYVVETVSPVDIPQSGAVNAWNANEYEIKSETIKNILPSNQLLRSWDNVPKKALAQEVTGNRIVYANYEQNFNLLVGNQKYKPQFKNYLSTRSDNSAIGSVQKSIKSLRDYKLGVVFTDEYGRETPILISESGGFKVDKVDSTKSNMLVASLDGGFPANMAYFKFFIKETSSEYYNLAMDRWYEAEDGNIWLAFPSTDRNKVDLETSLYFKKGNDEAVENTTRYKILAIENEAPEFIKTRRVQIGTVKHNAASGTNDLFGDGTDTLIDAPAVGEVDFIMNYIDDFAGSSLSNLEDITDDLFIQFFTGNDYSQQYKVAQVSSDKLNQGQFNPPTEYYITLAINLKDDIEFIFDNAAAPDSIRDDVKVIFTKAIVENSPKFEGRFFAKIENDGKIKPQISGSTGINYIEKASKMVYSLDYDGILQLRSRQASLIDAHAAIGIPSYTGGVNLVTRNFNDGINVYPGTGSQGDNNPAGINWNYLYSREAYFRNGYDQNHDGPYEPLSGDGVFFIDKSTYKYSSNAGADGSNTDLIWSHTNNMNGFTPQDNNPAASGWTDNANTGPGVNHFSTSSSMRLGFGGFGFDKPDGTVQTFEYDGTVMPNQYYGEFSDFFSVGEEGVGNHQDAPTVRFVERLEAGTTFKWEHDPTGTVYTFINQTQKTNRVRFGRHDAKIAYNGQNHTNTLIYAASSYHRAFNLNLTPAMTVWDPTADTGTFINNGLQLRGITLLSENVFGSANTTDPTVNTISVDTIQSVCSNGNSPNSEKHTLHKGMMLSGYNIDSTEVAPDNLNVIIKDISEFDGTGYTITLTGYHTPLHYESDDISTNFVLNEKIEFRQVTMNSVSNFTEANTDKYSAFWHNEALDGGSGGIGAVGYKMIMVEPVDQYSDGGNLPPDPFVWETEPKSDEGLDIYYEISDNNPIVLNNSTIHSAIPVGSSIESLSGEGYADWDNIIVTDNTSSTGDTITISEDVYIGPGALALQGGIELQPVQATSVLKITKPNGTAFSVRVAEVFPNPNFTTSSRTFRLQPFLYNSDYFLNWYNCFSFGNGVESNRIKDNFNLPFIANGIKASTTLDTEYKQERRKYGLIYSGIYNSTSGVNNLNQFIQAEKITKDVNPAYGSIQKLKSGWGQGGDLVALCEDRVLRILANKDALFNADGSSNVTATNRVLGTATPYSGEYGISTNPESFASESYRAYFTDKVRGAVLRLSNDGLTAISDAGMKDWFRDNLKLTNTLFGSYDDKKSQYNITLGAGVNKTVTYKENVKGWVSFKSFIPENAISNANEYYTFKNGNLWRHHDENSPRNTFYNIHSSLDYSTFNVVLNDAPGSVKSFKTINYEGSKSKIVDNLLDDQYYNLTSEQGWYVDSIFTNKQTGSIPEFIEKEGKWFNYIKGNSVQHAGDTNILVNPDGSSSFDQASFAIQGLGVLMNTPIVDDPVGCTDPTAINYDPIATIDSGGCIFQVDGCVEPSASNYDPSANTDDGSCVWYGCTDPNASNTTVFPNVAYSYNNGNSIHDDGSCVNIINGCTDPTAVNYDSNANTDDGSCVAAVYGCMESTADNFAPLANVDDNTCIWYGCTEPLADNYFNATYVGNPPPQSVNYTPLNANYGLIDDGSCEGGGCIDATADNYDPNATYDPLPGNGSCLYCDWSSGMGAYTGVPAVITAYPENYQNTGGSLDITLDQAAPYMPYTYELEDSQGNILASTTFDIGIQAPAPYANVSMLVDNLGNVTFSALPPEIYTVTIIGNSANGANVCTIDFTNNVIQSSNLVQFGCTDPSADNYNDAAQTDDGSCVWTNTCYECDNAGLVSQISIVEAGPDVCGTPGVENPPLNILEAQDLVNNDEWFGTDIGDPCIPGCQDSSTDNDGNFIASNYNPNATWDPQDQGGGQYASCIYPGCTDATANNYVAYANENDGSCTYDVPGCMDLSAVNYNPNANVSVPGDCVYLPGAMVGVMASVVVTGTLGSGTYGQVGGGQGGAIYSMLQALANRGYAGMPVLGTPSPNFEGNNNGLEGIVGAANPASGGNGLKLRREVNGVDVDYNLPDLTGFDPTHPNGPMFGYTDNPSANDFQLGDIIFLPTDPGQAD